MSNERAEENLRRFDELERQQFRGQLGLADIKTGIFEAVKQEALNKAKQQLRGPKKQQKGANKHRGPTM